MFLTCYVVPYLLDGFFSFRSTKDRPAASCATPPGTRLSVTNMLGSLRLNVQYTADHVFHAQVYEPLRNLLLQVKQSKVSFVFH